MHHPGFSCPLCRTFADLEADVEVEHRDMEASAMEDVEMGLGDVGGAHVDATCQEPTDMSELREADVDADADDMDDAEDGDGDGDRTSSSLSNEGGAIDADADPAPPSNAIPIARQDSGASSFPGAEATPLNHTFLATLTQTNEEGNATNSGTGAGLGVPVIVTALNPIAMSDEGESGEDGVGGEVGGKRKR